MELCDVNTVNILAKLSPLPGGRVYSEKPVFRYTITKDLSIIIPCYNSQEYLEKCLQSVLEQKTSFNIEVIAINDGSTDNTAEILAQYEKKYQHLKVISQSNKGFSGARNTGIICSRGKYLMFVDSDDGISDGYIQKLMEAAVKNSADIAASGYFTFRGKKIYKTIRAKGYNDKGLLNGCLWAKVFKREIFENIMLPDGYWYEDSILEHLIYPTIKNYVSVEDCLYAYRSNPRGITISSRRRAKSIDTFYISDLMIKSAIMLYGVEYIKTQHYYELLLEQFYLNHRRIANLPVKYQKVVFKRQADFLNSVYTRYETKRPERVLFQKALRSRSYRYAMISVHMDRFYKFVGLLCKGRSAV